MEHDTSNKEAGDEELVVLLRTLRVEAVAEAHFEERFLVEFRERLAREAVCRPARTLLWEHLVQMVTNMGRRRLAWGVSAVTLSAVCLSMLMLYQERPTHTARSMRLQMLMPEASSSEDVVRTPVYSHTMPKNYTDRILASRPANSSAYWKWVGGVDELEPAKFPFATPSVAAGTEHDSSFTPDIIQNIER